MGEICAGFGPWISPDNFLHQFFAYYQHLRADPVRESVELPNGLAPALLRRAVFCAAFVADLCGQYNLACPVWALEPAIFSARALL
ncbi:MAG TPA: hypothetical protein VGF67_25880 [Ktedonobacteraceae bacterium]